MLSTLFIFLNLQEAEPSPDDDPTTRAKKFSEMRRQREKVLQHKLDQVANTFLSCYFFTTISLLNFRYVADLGKTLFLESKGYDLKS